MSKFISKFFLALSVALMTAGFAACSNDNGDDPDNGGNKGDKMTGWIEVDGKKYTLKYCFDDGDELGYDNNATSTYIVASTLDLDNINSYKKRGDLAEFYVVKQSNGTIDYSLELFPNCKLSGDDEDETGYATSSYSHRNVVVYNKDGEYVEFSCDDATFTYYDADGNDAGTVHGKFSFKGVPRKFKNMVIE